MRPPYAPGPVRDLAGDREARRSAGRRSVHHMDCGARFGDHEILDEAPVTRDRLRADPGRGRPQVVGVDFWNVSRQIARVNSFQPVTGDLSNAHAPVAGEYAPESRPQGRVDGIADRESEPPVPFPSQGEHRVRASPDLAVDAAREMYAQER